MKKCILSETVLIAVILAVNIERIQCRQFYQAFDYITDEIRERYKHIKTLVKLSAERSTTTEAPLVQHNQQNSELEATTTEGSYELPEIKTNLSTLKPLNAYDKDTPNIAQSIDAENSKETNKRSRNQQKNENQEDEKSKITSESLKQFLEWNQDDRQLKVSETLMRMINRIFTIAINILENVEEFLTFIESITPKPTDFGKFFVKWLLKKVLQVL